MENQSFQNTDNGWHQERCPECGSTHVDVFTSKEGTMVFVTITCSSCGAESHEVRRDFGC